MHTQLDSHLAHCNPFDHPKIEANDALKPHEIWDNHTCGCEWRKIVRASVVVGYTYVPPETPPYEYELRPRHVMGEDHKIYREIPLIRYMEVGDWKEVYHDELLPVGKLVPDGKKFMRPGREPRVQILERCPDHGHIPDLLVHQAARHLCRCKLHYYEYYTFDEDGNKTTHTVALAKIKLCPKHEDDSKTHKLIEMPAIIEKDTKAARARMDAADREARLERLYNDPNARLVDFPTVTMAELTEFLITKIEAQKAAE